MTKEIALTQGKVALVDDEDYEWLNQWKWGYGLNGRRSHGYAVRMERRDGKKIRIKMHRLLLGLGYGDKKEVDHIDRNTLNNCRANLRTATNSQNQCNKMAATKNKTGYKGVRKNGHKYRAQLNYKGKQTHLGMFKDPEAAAKAYDKKAIELYGEYARLNFPREEANV